MKFCKIKATLYLKKFKKFSKKVLTISEKGAKRILTKAFKDLSIIYIKEKFINE